MSSPAERPAGDGLAALQSRRERNRRQAPPPKHPRKDPPPPADVQPQTPVLPAAPVDPVPSVPAAPLADPPSDAHVDASSLASSPVLPRETAGEVSREIVREIAHADEGAPPPVDVQPQTPVHADPRPVAPAAVAPVDRQQPVSAYPMPSLDLDLSDPAMMLYSPTVLSIPADVKDRFEVARKAAPSHTGLVLDALRVHAPGLPELVLAKRPGPRPGDLFPLRAEAGTGGSRRPPQPLRVRPLVGELRIMDLLTEWVNSRVQLVRPGAKKVTRSEVVAVALDAALPPLPRKRHA